MQTKNRPVRGALISAIIILMLACNLPVSQTPALHPALNESSVTPIPITSTPIQPSLTPKSVVATMTPSPTVDFTNIINSGGGATQPVLTSSPTMTLPAPNFDSVVDFGGGGAGGFCTEGDLPPNNISITQQGGGLFNNSILDTCFYLQGIKFSQPFTISMMQIGGDGTIMMSPDIRLDQENKVLKWIGYQNPIGDINWTSDGTLFMTGILIWWPLYFPPGQWQMTITQRNSGFSGFSTNFQIKDEGAARINVVGSVPRYEIIPAYSGWPPRHPVRLKENGKADFIGKGFPSNAPIYILLYGEESSDAHMYLIDQLTVLSGADGSINSELPANLQSGKTYVLVGVSDSNTRIAGDFGFNRDVPYDIFTVDASGSANSCLGAPAQRMTVNQRGYVCTRSDSVTLRKKPSRSGNEIMQLNSGTTFTVIGGPSCANNWSWWKIRLDDGTIGWISEGSDEVDPYFICPLP